MYEALGLEDGAVQGAKRLRAARLRQDPQDGHRLRPPTCRRRRLNTLRNARGEDANVHPIAVGPRGRAAARRAHLRPDGLRRQVPRLRGVPDRAAPVRTDGGLPRPDRRGLRVLRRQRQLLLERPPPGDDRQGPQPLRGAAEQVRRAPGATAASITRTRRRSTDPFGDRTRCGSSTSRSSPACRRTSSSPRS